jgi:uncharacterized protein YxjI
VSDTDAPAPGTYRAQRSSAAAALLGNSAFSDSWKVIDSSGATVLDFEFHPHLTSQEWRIKDASGSELGAMTRGAGHIHWTYEIQPAHGGAVTFSKQSFAFAHETWRLQGTAQGDVDLEGDLTNHNFTFVDASRTVLATVNRPWVSVKDTIDVQISGLDPLVALSAVIALDSMEHTSR